MIWQVIMIISGIFTDLKAFSQPHYFWISSSLMIQLEWIAQSPEAPKASSSKPNSNVTSLMTLPPIPYAKETK